MESIDYYQQLKQTQDDWEEIVSLFFTKRQEIEEDFYEIESAYKKSCQMVEDAYQEAEVLWNRFELVHYDDRTSLVQHYSLLSELLDQFEKDYRRDYRLLSDAEETLHDYYYNDRTLYEDRIEELKRKL